MVRIFENFYEKVWPRVVGICNKKEVDISWSSSSSSSSLWVYITKLSSSLLVYTNFNGNITLQLCFLLTPPRDILMYLSKNRWRMFVFRYSYTSVNVRMTLSFFFYHGRKCKRPGRRKDAERDGILAAAQHASACCLMQLLCKGSRGRQLKFLTPKEQTARPTSVMQLLWKYYTAKKCVYIWFFSKYLLTI